MGSPNISRDVFLTKQQTGSYVQVDPYGDLIAGDGTLGSSGADTPSPFLFPSDTTVQEEDPLNLGFTLG